MTRPTPELSVNQYLDRVRGSEKHRVVEQRQDIVTLMSEPWGRRVMYRLIYEVSGVLDGCFNFNIKDGASSAQYAAHADGRRSIGAALLKECQKTAPQQYVMMMEEANHRAQQLFALREDRPTDQPEDYDQ